MGYISGFGTKCAALTLVLGLSLTTSGVSATDGLNVAISISGLRNHNGQVMVCLTKNPKAFPDCGKDTSALRKMVPATDANSIQFTGVAPGTYAVAAVHDENNNNKMDVSVFIPKEGFAFSRNPVVAFGPPKFRSASFIVADANAEQRVKMKYML